MNDTIKRIRKNYNAEEVLTAKKEHQDAVLIPDFSCHHLRHTFATRLCETETNLKVIQSIMGHRSIETTMDIYAEATERKKQESFEVLAAKLDSIFRERILLEPYNKNHQMQQFDNEFVFITKNNTLSQQG